MNEKNRIYLLIGIMSAVTLITGSLTFFMLYTDAFKGQEARLSEVVQSQARMIESAMRHETIFHGGDTGTRTTAVLELVRRAHSQYKGFGKTGEFTLARRDGNRIVFLLSHREQKPGQDGAVSFDSDLAEPMRQALEGKSGTLVGRDYQGVIVLAAYEPVALLNLGLVAKIDLAEIRTPFIKSGIIVTIAGIIVVLIGSLLFITVSNPIIRRLEEHIRQIQASADSLSESENRFKRIIQSNADAIVVTLEDIICFANPAAETIFGLPARELVGKNIGFPVIGHECVDIQIPHPSGKQVIAILRAVEIEWDGKPGFLISLHDITERKMAEERIHNLNRVILALRKVNQLITKEKNRDRLIQEICDNMVATRGFRNAWVALVDKTGAYAHFAQEGIGNSFQAFKQEIENGRFPHCMQEALAHSGVRVVADTGGECDDCLLQSLSSDSAVFCIRLEHEQKIYGVLSCAVSSHFMRDEEEKSLFQEIGEDISFALNNFEMEEKQRQAEDENKELEARLRQSQKIESIGMLAGGIAHDFNNILTVVLGFTQLALEKIDKGSDLEDDLREITRAGMRAKDLISQIMTFARQTDDKISPIRMDVIVKEVVHFIRSSIPSTIEIKSNIFSKASVMGNPSQIHQIFMNLFTNAAYAMKDHGGVLGVGLEDCRLDHEAVLMYPGMKPGDYIKVMVSDTGEGIPPGIIDTIFEPYFTTKEPGEGTGLGLAVVHGIVSSYGGSISVSSQSGKGTVFTFYLPVTTKEGTQDLLESTEPTKGTERILVVDDESPIAKLNEKMLENLGYTVVSRTDSPEALELLESGPYDFDLVVTDMTMPKLTGVDLAEVMMDIRPELPFILCTGYSRKLQLNPEMPSNIRGVLNKPIQKAELADAIRKILNGS